MATDLLRYDLLVQDALRSVVRTVLSDAAKNGLKGDHHFFITFRTDAAGLRLSDRMRERYPEEMTIILQHQFWDLAVTEHAFEVGLSFSNKPERLLVPFAAITTFHDPSVQFGLKFELGGDASAEDGDEPPAKPAAEKRTLTAVATQPTLVEKAPAVPALPTPLPTASAKPLPRPVAKPKPLEAVGGPGPGDDAAAGAEKSSDAKADGKASDGKSGPKGRAGVAAVKGEAAEGGDDAKKVVSIDAFRKKT